MQIDLVCGSELTHKKGIMKKYGDRPYSFCCNTCKERFFDNPFQYLDRSPMHTGSSILSFPKRRR